jgi:hypothetical protein
MVSLPVRRYAAGVLENLRYQRGLGESGGPEGRPRHQHLTPADSVSSDDCRLSDTDPGASHSGAEIFSPSHTGRRRSTRSSTSSSTSTAQPSTQRRSAGSSASSGRHAASFAIVHSDSLNRLEIEDWRATISAGSRHNVFRKRKRHERKPIIPFESWAEIEAIADELRATT